MRIVLWGLVSAISVCAGVQASPIAVADFGVTDLDGLSSADADSYGTYATYGAGGWQFVTPDGVRCRIMTYMRWSGPPEATCWGALPGVTGGENVAFAAAPSASDTGGPDHGAAPHSGLKRVPDLSSFETYRSYEHRDGPVVDQVDPHSYHLLASGWKIFEKGPGANVTCGVKGPDTVCVVESTGDQAWSYGFVLSPEGSHAI